MKTPSDSTGANVRIAATHCSATMNRLDGAADRAAFARDVEAMRANRAKLAKVTAQFNAYCRCIDCSPNAKALRPENTL